MMGKPPPQHPPHRVAPEPPPQPQLPRRGQKRPNDGRAASLDNMGVDKLRTLYTSFQEGALDPVFRLSQKSRGTQEAIFWHTDKDVARLLSPCPVSLQ